MAELEIGTRVGPYKIVGKIGAGGMGVVYRAVDTRLGRNVALKTLADFLTGDAEAIHRFELEARAVSALAHPNVLTIHDYGKYKGTPYQVSELLVGETLRTRLQRGRLQHDEVLEYAVQFASGLAAAHDAGIVHRDLKPENVYITGDGRLKILDFGLAKLLPQARIVPERLQGKAGVPDMKTQQGTILGTVAYMSPEQVQGAAADRRSDVFAFGSILYEMLSGQAAFSGSDMRATGIAILSREPAPVPDAPPALEQIARRCLKKEPAERFESGRELHNALRQLHPSGNALVAGAGPERAPAAPRLADNETKLRAPAVNLGRRRLLWWSASSAVVLVVAVVVYRIVGKGGSTPPPPPPLSIQQITFRRGAVRSARFRRDAPGVVYSAAWDGKPDRTETVMPGNPAAQTLDLPAARVLSVSRTGELAISIGDQAGALDYMTSGTLARVPISGGAPRQLFTDVLTADWDAQGTELAVARSVEGKSRVEYPPGKVLYTSDGWISSLRVSPRGQIAFVDHPFFGDTRGTVMVVDREGRSAKVTSEIGSAIGLAWSRSGDEIWFTGGETQQSAALRATTLDGKQRVIKAEGGALMLHDVADDGRVLITRESWRHVIRGARAGSSEEQSFSWQDYSIARELSADGTKLLLFEAGQAGGEQFSAFLSAMDGKQPVLLGPGYALSLSTDGKWALLGVTTAPSELKIVPTGPGESRKLPLPVAQITEARWFPGAKTVLVTARERAGGPMRMYLVDAATGRLHALTEAGLPGQEMITKPISPDGKRVLVARHDGFFVYPVGGGNPERVEGLTSVQIPVGWHPDGTTLLVREPGLPMKVSRLDPKTRRQQPWRSLSPPDAAGVSDIPWLYLASSPAGETYVYTYPQILSDLYIYRVE